MAGAVYKETGSHLGVLRQCHLLDGNLMRPEPGRFEPVTRVFILLLLGNLKQVFKKSTLPHAIPWRSQPEPEMEDLAPFAGAF